MKLIQVSEPGGPEVLKLTEKPVPTPNAGEVLVRLEAIGVNFIDVYHRTGLYPLPLPFTPGMEGAGSVEDVGPDVTGLKRGDRVAWAMHAGSYAEYAKVPASRLVRVPESVTSEQAAAAMLQGMTAHYLTTSVYNLKRGDWALVHAAAGGVGLLLVQLAKRVEAKVIGTVSTAEKAKLAREAGADEVINYKNQDFESESRRITNGSGVNVVYDSVGQSTFMKSLASLAPRGMLALFGQSSGSVPPFDPALLAQKGSFSDTTEPCSLHVDSR